MVLLWLTLLTAQDKNLRRVERLSKLLAESQEFRVRLQAAKALGLLQDSRAVPALVKAMRQDQDKLVRGAAAWALGYMGNPGAFGFLKTAAADPEVFVSAQAKRALAHISSKFPGNLPAYTGSYWTIELPDPGRQAGSRELVQAFSLELSRALGTLDRIRVHAQGKAAGPVPEDQPVIALRALLRCRAGTAPGPALLCEAGLSSIDLDLPMITLKQYGTGQEQTVAARAAALSSGLMTELASRLQLKKESGR